ncbi:MAG TPA: UDP-N-acetylmuramoyl-tripeptide--D-alanyl-D-alanine ligase [candidate division Zixibacteria bacterium]|nr:UDP-N-acetylmuramoyl-tripeptide--D-alanyl-D-alanine ligase [candidate division Zixibacteria bacterium]
MPEMTETDNSLFTILEVGEILGSKSEGDPGFHQTSINGISTDSREVLVGELFVAIKGKNFDGHDFLTAAFNRGAVAAVVARDRAQELHDPKYIVVDDTLRALGDLAAAYRQKMTAKVVAVTGSNGKTTVKNMIFEILSRGGSALRSIGNFNNLIGLPLSVLHLRPQHLSAVFELGMSARGEISRLGEIAAPDVAVITNVGPVHLEFLKTIEAVAEAKLEIVDRIKDSGILIINGDDTMLGSKLKKTTRKVLRFGIGTGNDIRPSAIEFDNRQMSMIRMDDVVLTPNLPGIHNVYNALAAFAVARALDIPSDEAAMAINFFKAEDMRSEVFRKNGVTLLIDCYNANPASTKYALETLSKMRSEGHHIAVLGDMLELGKSGRAYHEEIGDAARRLKIDYLLALGPLSKYTVASFGQGGIHFENIEALLERLLKIINTGDIILFKGSRGMVLENAVDAVKSSL